MADLIDRQAALEQQYLGYTRVSDTEWQKGYWEGVDSVCDNLRKLPSVDAVEVVRCKDCKFSELEFFADNGTTRTERYKCLHHRMGINILEHDDFCSYGEKRGENND